MNERAIEWPSAEMGRCEQVGRAEAAHCCASGGNMKCDNDDDGDGDDMRQAKQSAQRTQ